MKYNLTRSASTSPATFRVLDSHPGREAVQLSGANVRRPSRPAHKVLPTSSAPETTLCPHPGATFNNSFVKFRAPHPLEAHGDASPTLPRHCGYFPGSFWNLPSIQLNAFFQKLPPPASVCQIHLRLLAKCPHGTLQPLYQEAAALSTLLTHH